MNNSSKNGERRLIDGTEHIFYYGYWIRYYSPPKDTLSNRKRLIDNLTRRAFHQTEAGINTPGRRLEAARAAFAVQTHPERKRVNAAMLAGSLFNRATDLFTSIVDLAELGVKVSKNNELMRECSECFEEALRLGKQVKHHSGCEGIDEIWGEPFKAFTMTPAEFYHSRFIKIAQSMRDIDLVADTMVETFCVSSLFVNVRDSIVEYAAAARHVSGTMKTDPDIFDIWPKFVSLAEALDSFEPVLPDNADQLMQMRTGQGMALLREGKRLLGNIAGARVPMPLSTELYIEKCQQYEAPDIKGPQNKSHVSRDETG
ncbi:MAG: hypothetical protein IIB69_14205 [Proteobacteria bacterium]|nr:hypothetical protein [Pseudomonadota bacterium]MCH8176934.1 hypothetical protein [Pseudomonadota bacterium]